MTSNSQAQQDSQLDDLELQPPLEAVGSDISSRDRSVLHPLLCRMFVACNVLKLSNETRFASLVLLHRCFDASIPEEENEMDWKYVGAACLFIGTKTEEEIRRLRDIINVADILEFGAQDSVNNNPIENIHVKGKPMLLDKEYWKAKEQLVATEQRVLRMLQFDVTVSHPHRAVAVLLSQQDFPNKQELLPVCWKFLNQALFHAPALRYPVLILACAAIECVQTTLPENDQQSNGIPWWYKYGVDYNSLESCKRSLEQAVSLAH